MVLITVNLEKTISQLCNRIQKFFEEFELSHIIYNKNDTNLNFTK